ncbi:MAG: SCO family protein [Rhodothermales bacterium]|nr:SCO family protein [Rhodothermales bacterium]
MVQRLVGSLALALLGLAYLAQPAAAQLDERLAQAYDGAGVVEHLGDYLPLDLSFADESGDSVVIGDYFDGSKPVLLSFAYHECPMLCSVVLDGLAKTLREMDWIPGEQFDVVTVSIAANETPDLAMRQKERFVAQVGKDGVENGWHFLTGKEENIEALSNAAGFQFKWIEQAEQFVHPAVLIFAGSEGKITRYLYGLEYPPRDVRTALVEASEGKIGTSLDRLILFCFQYDATVSGYVLQATRLMRLGGFLMIGALVALFLGLRRRERRKTERNRSWNVLAGSD